MIDSLKVRSVNNCVDVTVEIDEYIPFTLEFGAASRRNCFYYRFGNRSTSILEFGIDKDSFTPKNITLLSLNSSELLSDNLRLKESIINVEGLPVIDEQQGGLEPLVEFASQNRADINSDLNLYIKKSSVLLTFGEYAELSHIYKNGSIRFLVNNDKELIGLEILELSKDSIEIMESAII